MGRRGGGKGGGDLVEGYVYFVGSGGDGIVLLFLLYIVMVFFGGVGRDGVDVVYGGFVDR